MNNEHGRAHRQFHTSAQTPQIDPCHFDDLLSFILSRIQFYRNSNVITNAIRDASILETRSHVKHKFLTRPKFGWKMFYCFGNVLKQIEKCFHNEAKIQSCVEKLIRSGIASEKGGELADWKRANNRHEHTRPWWIGRLWKWLAIIISFWFSSRNFSQLKKK